MQQEQVGLDDIEVYLPEFKIDLDTIYKKRVADDPSQVRRLAKAIESTGQKAIRFPAYCEDSATMAASATHNLLLRHNDSILKNIRYLVSATETAVDLSKPTASYVLGMLAKAGINLGPHINVWQAQHACAAGTIAMSNLSASLLVSPKMDEKALVVCSDIARYEAPSSAEITQGAGAVSLLIGKNPKLLALDLATQGFSSADVDDFFRPLGSVTARVKGQYSMQCYHEASARALADYCERAQTNPEAAIRNHDYYVFHVPFAKMAYTAARSLLSQHLHLVDGEVDDYLKPKGFFEPLEATAQIGNMYTGAAFLNLASLLSTEYKRLGKAIIGKKILFSSYGSGNTMIVMSMTVMPGAPEVIESWSLDEQLTNYKLADFATYEEWIHKNWDEFNKKASQSTVPRTSFYLKSIRDDDYREYEIGS